MTIENNRAFMKDFFERYYSKRKTLDDICVKGVNIPSEMLADGADPKQEWNIWKLCPSTVTPDDFADFEKNLGIKLPECIKAFFSVYHHRFDTAIGRNDIRRPLYELERAFNPHLVSNGFFTLWLGQQQLLYPLHRPCQYARRGKMPHSRN